MSRAHAWGEAVIVDPFDARALSEVERARLATQQSASRRAEFVAGRLAARSAITALLGAPVEGLAIDRDDDGAPRIVGVDRPLALSISHAGSRAFALVAEGERGIGIDLCERCDAARVRRVARRAFPRAQERDLVLRDDTTACLAWATKEAIAKALRIGMMEQAGMTRIEIVSVDPFVVTVDGAAVDLTIEAREVDAAFLVAAL